MQHESIVRLHGDVDRERNGLRIQRVLIVFLIGTLAAAAGIVASFIWRDPTYMNNVNETPSQIVTIAITLGWGALLIFFWSMKLTPLLCYKKYLKEISGGLSRVVEGEVVRFDRETTFRDGISFYAMVVNIGDLSEPEDERLLYWDVKLTRPDIAPGDRVLVLAHGNDIIGLERR